MKTKFLTIALFLCSYATIFSQITFSTDDFKNGENIIEIKMRYINYSDSLIIKDFARVPIWFSKD